MEDIAKIGEAVAIIAACWAIISGVGAWKREFIGKRKIELAEEVLASFFEVKDAIAFMRSPFSSGNEGKTRQRADNETKEESELLDRGYIVYERYNAKKETFVKFNTLKYRFMAAFGAETEAIFNDTSRTLNSIFVSAQMLATHYWQRQGRVQMADDEFRRHLDKMHEHEGVFWDRMNDDDEIRTQLQSIQERLDVITRPCFEEPMKSYSILTKQWWNKGQQVT
ncbi:hypothetical protein [Halomonas koreensis]|uniref:DUF4760 domain-containing protein n=1 Tax=Halomonas koreensis TaxID=245385 RepID=A0ABU1FZV1_9GAMM|nr:hypothetical protein [Halomonas koreensis]MDR5866216.1 hypothetical protein [Halomonas koreensis]